MKFRHLILWMIAAILTVQSVRSEPAQVVSQIAKANNEFAFDLFARLQHLPGHTKRRNKRVPKRHDRIRVSFEQQGPDHCPHAGKTDGQPQPAPGKLGDRQLGCGAFSPHPMPPAVGQRGKKENLQRRIGIIAGAVKQHALHRHSRQPDRESPQAAPDHQPHADDAQHQIHLIQRRGGRQPCPDILPDRRHFPGCPDWAR